MEVILLETIENLGGVGDQVKVRPGYGRNYLLPKGKATLATPENIALFEERRAELERREAGERGAAEERAAKLRELRLRLTAKAGTEGKIFGSLGTVDIVEACAAAGVDVERSEVRLPDGPLRTLGEHEIELHLHSEVNVAIRIEVVPEDETAEAWSADAGADDGDVAAGGAAADDESNV